MYQYLTCSLEDLAAARGNLEVRLEQCTNPPTNLLSFADLPRLAAAIQLNRDITGLDFEVKNRNIGDSGARAVSEAIGQLVNLTSLKLNLNDYNIGDSGARAVSEAIGQLVNLRSLKLRLWSK